LEFLADYGLFFAKTLTIVVALAVIITLIAASSLKGHGQSKGHIEVTKLNEKLDDIVEGIKSVVLPADELKLAEKARKKEEKEEKKKDEGQIKGRKKTIGIKHRK